jgi:hypothetical protein
MQLRLSSLRNIGNSKRNVHISAEKRPALLLTKFGLHKDYLSENQKIWRLGTSSSVVTSKTKSRHHLVRNMKEKIIQKPCQKLKKYDKDLF